MKIGIYPGSFNPWHKGHEDILIKALQVFDHVVVIQMLNPEKDTNVSICNQEGIIELSRELNVTFVDSSYVLLKDAVKGENGNAVIRGLRNGHDLQYEMNQQYWNEDIGLNVPFVYFVTDRNLSHVSSSSIRAIEKLGLEHKY